MEWPEAWGKPCLRIGHAGAGHYAPHNSLESLALGLQMGADAIEFDVQACQDGLVLLHDEDMAQFEGGQGAVAGATLQELRALKTRDGARVATLDEALDLIKGRALMNVDLKGAGHESAVLDVLRDRGVVDDVIISSNIAASLRAVREIEPSIRTGISHPQNHSAAGQPLLRPLVKLAVKLMRRTLPLNIAGVIEDAHASAVMLNYHFVTVATVRRVHAAGKRIFVWTVDDVADIERIHTMGVDGITSNRPDLFAQIGPALC